MRNYRSFNNWPKEFGTFLESKGFESTSHCVQEDISGGLNLAAKMQLALACFLVTRDTAHGKRRFDFVVVNIARHIFDFRIIFPDSDSSGRSGGSGGSEYGHGRKGSCH